MYTKFASYAVSSASNSCNCVAFNAKYQRPQFSYSLSLAKLRNSFSFSSDARFFKCRAIYALYININQPACRTCTHTIVNMDFFSIFEYYIRKRPSVFVFVEPVSKSAWKSMCHKYYCTVCNAVGTTGGIAYCCCINGEIGGKYCVYTLCSVNALYVIHVICVLYILCGMILSRCSI